MSKGTVNRVTLLGRLGQDPDIRTTASGTQIANLNIATTEIGAKDQQGNRQEHTEWHRCTAFGRTAEVAGQYLQKGSQVYIEGRLQTRKWQDQNGQDRYTTEIVVNEMQFIGGRSDSAGSNQSFGQAPQQGGHTPQAAQPQQAAAQQQPVPQAGFNNPPPAPQGGGFDDYDDDIPF